ncbi:hypothetical protein MKX01_037481 [Papaver californicum]|nr:hypothetical protein MKX01_037481 [Papaver californicum]
MSSTLNDAAASFGHNHIFVSGGAAAALVMLFVSQLQNISRQSALYLNTLGKMLTYMQDMHSAKGTVLIQGLSLYVFELGCKVIKGLDSCINSQQIPVMSLPGDVRDFIAFLSPLCNAIAYGLDEMGLLPICLTDLLPCFTVELRTLHVILLEMLGKIDECLKEMEISVGKSRGKIDGLSCAWSQYLFILKALNTLQVALNALILHSRRSDDHRWILKHKDLTSFESRRHLTMMLLSELKDGHLFEMLLDREKLLAESFECISKADVKDMLGATGLGVLRERFCLVCQAICNPQNALFLACPHDNRRFFPNPASDTVSLEDVRDADPLFYLSCKKILEMDTDLLDSDALDLTFVREVEKLRSRKIEELHPGGNSIPLNSKNREAYVNLLIQHRFVNSVSQQVKQIAKGFSEILCETSLLELFFQSLEHEDLDRMLHGSDRAICVEDWKAHTDYNGCKRTGSQIIWFWKIVEGMSDEQRRGLLFFWTSVKYLRVEGFGRLQSRLHIYKSHNSHERLPSAHTCFYLLCLSRYKSKAIMQKSLQNHPATLELQLWYGVKHSKKEFNR